MIRRRIILICCDDKEIKNNKKIGSFLEKFTGIFKFKKSKKKEDKIDNSNLTENVAQTQNKNQEQIENNDENVLNSIGEEMDLESINNNQNSNTVNNKKPFYKNPFVLLGIGLVSFVLIFRFFIAPILNDTKNIEKQPEIKSQKEEKIVNPSDTEIPGTEEEEEDNKGILQKKNDKNESASNNGLTTEKLFKKRCSIFMKNNDIKLGLNNQIYINDNIYSIGDVIDFDGQSDNVSISGIKFLKPDEVALILSNKEYNCSIPVDVFKNFEVIPYIEAITIKEKNTGKSIDYMIGETISFGIKLKDIKDNGIVLFDTPAGIYVYKTNKD